MRILCLCRRVRRYDRGFPGRRGRVVGKCSLGEGEGEGGFSGSGRVKWEGEGRGVVVVVGILDFVGVVVGGVGVFIVVCCGFEL